MTVRAKRYLCARRALGLRLDVEGEQLLRFALWADRQGRGGQLKAATAIDWALSSRKATRTGHARRLGVVRRFARWLQASEADVEVPPAQILGPSSSRRPPNVLRDVEIRKLLAAAGRLAPAKGLRPITFRTLFGLLACTGLRPGEATRLTREDVDLRAGHVLVRETKFGKSRLVPLHESTTRVLRRYTAQRDRRIAHPATDAFFLLDGGRPATTWKARWALRCVRRSLGWVTPPGRRHLRLHDMRHSFTCHRLARWHAQGMDVNVRLPRLSTYLGHSKVASTYWYLTAVPELLAVCAARFERAAVRWSKDAR